LEDNFVIEDPGFFYLDDDNDRIDGIVPTDEEYGDMIQEPTPDVETYDKYLNAEFVINRGDEPICVSVNKRARTDGGNVIGQAHKKNPMFDTREYKCILDDGTIKRYSANIIAENLYSQCNDEGHSFVLLAEIIDHKKDASAISIADGFTTSRNGNRVPKKMTRGWQLLYQWKDGSSSWIPLVELKQSNPIILAEYAIANHINEESAFKWCWISDVL
jgi:hypothetical protein